MPVDYSKWDAIELSDDSDIEVHPNVDKRSFIRAKQAKIHQDRARRRHQIETLNYERLINDGLILRIGNILTALKSHKPEAAATKPADELVLQSLFEAAVHTDPKNDRPPPPPVGVYTNEEEQPTYSKMMAALMDQVKQEVDKSGAENKLVAFIDGVQGHKDKVEGLQKELLAKLAELEKEEKKHITSDDIHTGFDVSHVANKRDTPSQSSKTAAEVELLNPKPPVEDAAVAYSSGAEADVEDTNIDMDNVKSIKASKEAKEFSRMPWSDYNASQQFLFSHRGILTEQNSDGLLIEAFNAQLDGNEEHARNCVHQALLIQYCRQLGADGVGLFFKRIAIKEHQASKLFTDDVHTTYRKIKQRAAKLKEEEQEDAKEVEQIQLQAVDPNTTINIQVPPPIPKDLGGASAQPPPTEQQIHGRKIFESFPPGLRKALEVGSLDEVNIVLGKMSVDEAEEVVGKLSEGGILSVEEGVLDTTTPEGKQVFEDMQKEAQAEGLLAEDPPLD